MTNWNSSTLLVSNWVMHSTSLSTESSPCPVQHGWS